MVQKRRHLIDFSCGVGSAVVTTLITYPINKLVFRQIIERGSVMNVYHMLKREGPFLLYRGVLPPMAQKAVALSTMFGVYNYAIVPLRQFNWHPVLQKIAASYIAGTAETAFCPFERIQIILVHARYNNSFKNTFDAVYKLARKYGIKEFYRGATIMWCRDTLSNSCFFVTKAYLKERMGEHKSSATINFITGGFLGMFMSTLFYPFKVMKVEVQKDIGGPYMSVVEAFKLTYNLDNEGFKNFYKGVVMNANRSVITWGLANMTYEYLKLLLSDPNIT